MDVVEGKEVILIRETPPGGGLGWGVTAALMMDLLAIACPLCVWLC